MFTKPEQSEQLKIEIKRKMNNYDAAKRKRCEDTAPKRTRVKYDEAIGKINMNKTWIEWTTLKPGQTLKYKSRVFQKDVPDDQEKLMTRIIGSMNGYAKWKEKKELNNTKNAASTLMECINVDGTDNGMIAWEHVCDEDRKRESNREFKEYNDNYNKDDGGGGRSVINNNTANLVTIASALIDLSRGKGEESKSGEKTVEEIDDDGDLKPAAKSTNYILRHDKDSVNNNDEGGKEEDKEFDSFFKHNDEDTDIDGDGGTGAASNNDTNMAVELNFVDELTNLGNKKNKEINDGYNSADEERGGSFADISVNQQRRVDTGIDALLYAGLFDTSVRKQ
jgi:hypothetical protein